VAAAAIGKGATASNSTLTIIKGALKLMAWTKAKTAIVVGIGVLLGIGTTTVGVKKIMAYQIARDSWRIPRFAPDTVAKAAPQTRILPTKFKPPVYGQFWAAPDKWAGVRVTVGDMAHNAYHWPPGRIYFPDGEPQERYDFASTLPAGAAKAFQEQIKKTTGLAGRLQTMDTDVFVLKVRNLNAPGLKIHPKDAPMNARYDIRGHITSIGFPVSTVPPTPSMGLTRYLEMFLHTPVVDETDLKGRYDFDFGWNERGEQDPNHDALKEALLEKYGLEIVQDRRPVEMLVMEKAR
jgi:uncharacterized protein (TIGR03435 family)